MEKNIGDLDRMVRFGLGVLLLLLLVSGHAGKWAWIGLYPLFTGYFGVGFLYPLIRPFGFLYGRR